MAIHWAKLRSWNGSQQHAFEELCVQLAASENSSPDARFFRKGTPDAGVECFWQLANGDEWAWQAKFFLTSPAQSQWQQINDSVKTALQKHPRLRKYIVCLPVDLPDERRKGRQSALQKWGDYVSTWETMASKKGMSVSFEYWGQSELGGRLSNELHRGRLWFWFNEERFGDAWFVGRVIEAVENARDRYSPELSIELPLRSNFESLGRTPAFFSKLVNLYSEMRIKFKKLRPLTKVKTYEEQYDEMANLAQELFQRIEPWVSQDPAFVEWSVIRPIPWKDIGWLAGQLEENLRTHISTLNYSGKRSKSEKKNESHSRHEELDYQLYRLRDFLHSVTEVEEYAASSESCLSNQPALLLVGTAGQGKTHLLCDVAKQDTGESRPRIILHGEQFHNAEPWSQIVHLLGLNCSRDDLIGALEAAAQANNSRVLIFIDALNEGEGNRLWHKFLPGMLTTIAQSPWLGICVSVRSSYEQHIIPDSLDDNRIIRVEHTGFRDLAHDAAAKFFGHFRIEPSTPLLLPEFDNPLFLKLFCQSLQNSRLTRVPSGLRGITAIFKFFIESIDRKLSRPELLDYDPRSRVVEQAVDQLAAEMAKRKTDRLPLADAKAIVNLLLPREGHEKSLFRHLESESVVTVVPDYWRDDAEWTESLRFTYQRFSDHLITQRLLEQYLDKKTPKESFSKRGTLGKLVKDEPACWMNRGILEALAIQIPELTKKELPELAPHLSDLHPMRDAFVESVIWREAGSFGSGADRYIKNQVLARSGTFEKFWNALISLATAPGHPFNADHLHEQLSRMELAERDAWWSIFLHNHCSERGAIDRLVEWAWDKNSKSVFEDEVIRLAGIALTWFFTTANRFLRDRATKAMVRLCEKRIDVLRQIMDKFVGVNDPYVSERLYAVAHGCAMRTTDTEALGRLARDVYQWVFESGNPPPQILLRDYARGVIEVAIHRDAPVEIDIKRVRPPYRSEWPAIEVPALETLEPWREWSDRTDLAKALLYSSVMEDGDFSRYIIGDLHEWSCHRLDAEPEPTHKEIHERFVASLTERQREAWRVFCNVRSNFDFYRRSDSDDRNEVSKKELTDEEFEEARKSAERAFIGTLRKNSEKYKMYPDAAAYETEPHKFYREDRFDGEFARRWMMQRIIDMGWTLERFGVFDGNVNRYSSRGREANKPERIGKKYQWIAYHELLARLSDNFKMYGDEWSPNAGRFDRPWDEPIRRDIDPSNLLRKTQRDEWRTQTQTWWFPEKFTAWTSPATDLAWLKKDNLPSIELQIAVTNPDDGSKWLTLHGYYNWEQPTLVGEERYELKRRDLWYMLKGYLVKKADGAKLLTWGKKQSWMGRWMPESNKSYSVQLGEFFWSPVFKVQDCYYYGRQGWTRNAERGKNRIPAEILVANDEYGRESGGFDCSIEETIFIDLPCRFLVESMNLQWRGVEGHWFNEHGTLIAFDPSVRSQGPRVLLVRRDAIVEFLESQGLMLFWTLLGEKRSIGGSMSHREYKGRLEINGAYVLKDNAICGSARACFISAGEEGTLK